MKKWLAVLLLILTCNIVVFSNETSGRSEYFSFGLGFPSVSYGDEVDEEISYITNNGADRTTVSLNLDGGMALTKKVYIVAGLHGIGDRYTYLNKFIFQMNTYKITIGTRLYPFVTHLQLGADMGISKCILNSPYLEQKSSSPFGPAGKVSIAYDIDSDSTGVSLLFGLSTGFAYIDDEVVSDGSLYLNLVIK